MSSLRLPENAVSVLERAYHGDASTSEFDKWLVYTLGIPSSNANDLSHAAMESYNDQALGEPESGWETLAFLKPVDRSNARLQAPSLQHILEHHLAMIERQSSDQALKEDDEQQFYIFGFIVVTRSDWREHGVTAVHCDKDRGKWKVTQCSDIPVDRLGMELTSVSDTDDDFDNVRERYNSSNNDALDNFGGSAPEGEWQWLVYCKGISQMQADELIPDPRGGPDYRMGEGCLWLLDRDSSDGDVQEDFPVAYANAIKDPTIPSTSGERRICKVHPSLFAVIDSDDLQSVRLVKMQWDQDIGKSDRELRRVIQKSPLTIQSCAPHLVVATLEQLSTNT